MLYIISIIILNLKGVINSQLKYVDLMHDAHFYFLDRTKLVFKIMSIDLSRVLQLMTWLTSRIGPATGSSYQDTN